MKYLVTGGTGFIGSHVVDRIVGNGDEAVVLDRHANMRWHNDDREGVHYFCSNLVDPAAVSEAVAHCDRVIHLAAVLGTAETVDDPIPAVSTNIYGALNVFQAMRQYDRPGAYITVGNYWMNNSYSITKTTAERFAWMFNREHGTRIAVVRALNAYGPGQKSEPVRKIMPNFILPALRGEPITIYGDGNQIMDMIFVEDLADIMVRAADPGLSGDHHVYDPHRDHDDPPKFEAGSGVPTTVNDIAEAVLVALGLRYEEGVTVEHVPMRAGEPERSVVLGDPGTLKPLYGGEVPNLVRLAEGVERTIPYYEKIR